MPDNIERRDNTFPCRVELRAEPDGETQRTFMDIVAPPWGSLSAPLWRDYKTGKLVRERFHKGAAAALLSDESWDALAYRDHWQHNLVGRIRSGTLSAAETDEGLAWSIELPDTSEGRDLAELARRGDIAGASFEFSVDETDEDAQALVEEEDYLVREIFRIAGLFAVNPSATPAYPGSKLALEGRSVEIAAAAIAPLRDPQFNAAALAARRRRLELAELET